VIRLKRKYLIQNGADILRVSSEIGLEMGRNLGPVGLQSQAVGSGLDLKHSRICSVVLQIPPPRPRGSANFPSSAVVWVGLEFMCGSLVSSMVMLSISQGELVRSQEAWSSEGIKYFS
jgi:hypothetical protein